MPKSGGLEDQPAGLITRMEIVENVYNAFVSMKRAKSAATWADDNQDAFRIIANVQKMRRKNVK